MEIKLLNSVLFFALSFVQANGQDGGRSCNQTTVVDQYFGFKACHPSFNDDQLTFVGCGDRDIEFIAGFVAKAKKAKVIDITKSGLKSIDAIDLHQNVLLKKLIASDNKLQAFPTKCVSTAPALGEINLSTNQLSAVTLNDFKRIEKLDTIDLSSNAIVTIEKYSFVLLNHLKYLDLRNNHIRALQQIDFCGECAVTLHLEGNPIE